MKEVEFRETRGFCRLCETVTTDKAMIIPFRYSGKSAPIILCCSCIKELAAKVDDYQKPTDKQELLEPAPGAWGNITNASGSLALYLELEHNVEPIARNSTPSAWTSVYEYEGDTYKVTVDLAGNWTLEVLK